MFIVVQVLIKEIKKQVIWLYNFLLFFPQMENTNQGKAIYSILYFVIVSSSYLNLAWAMQVMQHGKQELINYSRSPSFWRVYIAKIIFPNRDLCCFLKSSECHFVVTWAMIDVRFNWLLICIVLSTAFTNHYIYTLLRTGIHWI